MPTSPADTAAAADAVRRGDTTRLQELLHAIPGLATAQVHGSRTLLHVVTDWPAHFPNVAATVAILVANGADVNASSEGAHQETPLHWAASADDVEAIDALLDAGANIESTGAVIGGGTPLADAVAFGQWNAARRLIARGARTTLWQAAALGLMDRVRDSFASEPPPAPADITNAFWCACHGGQREAAEYLAKQGADLHWTGYDNLTPLGAATRSGALELADWLRSQGAES